MLFFGMAAFGLLLVSDLNDAYFRTRALRYAFPAGAVLLAVATAGALRLPDTPLEIALLVLAALFLGFMLYALLIALPAGQAYLSQGQRRPVVTRGLYGLCRHPALWGFTGLYLCLAAGAGLPWLHAGVYILCNIALSLTEDSCIFPEILEGYVEYRRNTPFLLPRKHMSSGGKGNLRR